MTIQYLGTAASEAWPALFCRCEACEKALRLGGRNIRTRSQSIVDGQLLIDMPADSYYHALKFDIAFSSIESILITHSHEDHFNPMDLLLKAEPYAYNGAAKQISVYGNGMVTQILENAMEQSGLEKIREFIKPVYVRPYTAFTTNGYKVTPLLADHIPNEACYLYAIEKAGKSMLYAHDTGEFPDETLRRMQSMHFDVVSLDCTFVLADNKRGHMGLPNNELIRKKMMEIGCIDKNTKFVINHFSHNGRLIHDELEPLAAQRGFITAYDGMSLDF